MKRCRILPINNSTKHFHQIDKNSVLYSTSFNPYNSGLLSNEKDCEIVSKPRKRLSGIRFNFYSVIRKSSKKSIDVFTTYAELGFKGIFSLGYQTV